MPLEGNLDTTTLALTRAREILEADGWCRGRLTAPDGEHCLLGALTKAAGAGQDIYLAAQARVAAVLPQRPDAGQYAPGYLISAYNDEQHSVAPVLALLDRAISA